MFLLSVFLLTLFLVVVSPLGFGDNISGRVNAQSEYAKIFENFDPTADRDGDGCADTDITCNPHIREGTGRIAEEAWGEAGRVAYRAAAEITAARNPRAQSLSQLTSEHTHNHFLRQRYGNLVDQTRVIYNATTMDQWCAFGQCVDPDTAAQAFCDTIYVRDSYKPNDSAQLGLLAHEFRHIQQCRDVGGMSNFGYRYFKEYKRADLDYESNSMEVDARNAERDFLNNTFCPQIECPGYQRYWRNYGSFNIDLPVSYYFSGRALPAYHAEMPMFDPQWYLNNNSDVNDACKGNHACAKDHYLRTGLNECRNASPHFHPQWYLDNNPDVREVFLDCRGASEHWSGAGRREGRAGAPR